MGWVERNADQKGTRLRIFIGFGMVKLVIRRLVNLECTSVSVFSGVEVIVDERIQVKFIGYI